MKIISVDIYQYSLRMIRPLTQQNADPMVRNGCLICMIDQNNNEGWGEAAPLAGLSIETIDEVKKQLLAISNYLSGHELQIDKIIIQEFVKSLIKKFALSSSVQFAIESALINLVSANSRISFSKFLNHDASDSLKLNGLVAGDQNEMIAMAAQLIKNNYKTLKIKVGRRPIKEEIETIKKIVLNSSQEISFRFDANKSWSIKQYSQFVDQLPNCNIEYIEEPLSSFDDYDKIISDPVLTKIPIALDESLLNLEPDDFQKLNWVNAIVLKPSLFGFNRCNQFIKIAKQQGIAVTISSIFESSIGITTLAHYAAAKSNSSAGLDTINWLHEDICTNGIKIVKGQFDLKLTDQTRSPQIDYTLLTKLNSHE